MKKESHSWVVEKQPPDFAGTTIKAMRCEVCGVTGVRYGMACAVKRAPKFRSVLFDVCDERCKEAAKRQQEISL